MTAVEEILGRRDQLAAQERRAEKRVSRRAATRAVLVALVSPLLLLLGLAVALAGLYLLTSLAWTLLVGGLLVAASQLDLPERQRSEDSP